MAVVFSDIVGSTALRTRMGELDFTALREAHDAVAADLVEACGGEVVRWQGDGLVVAFSSAGQALEYASMLQPSVDQLGNSEARLDLRIGIGLGDVLNETTGDYDGPAFVDAARLCDAAEPRQVLCTDLVSRASRAYASADFGPPVEMALKGLGAVEVREFLRRTSPTVASGLTVSVLGSLHAERAGRELDLGGPKERRLLAVLAAGPNSAVGVDELIEALWSDEPPRTAERSIQSYVARLRKALEPARTRGAPPRVVVSDGRGYRLALGRDALDSTRFEHLATTSREHLAAGHALRARHALDDALALWRGSPFIEHFDSERCAQEAHRLEEIRQLVLEDLTTARLALGEAADLVPDLEKLVARHPLQERLWANLMLALYRAGRQADALRTFQRARAALVDELGVEPGPELRHLEAAILDHDPSLLTTSPGTGLPSRHLPAALDPGGAALVGRDHEIALLRAAWERAFAGRGEFMAVVGPDGVGKTRLVAELAVEAFDAGAMILHARCDAADRGPEALFDRALRGAGAQFADVPTTSGGTAGAALAPFLTSWSGGRPVLLCLDDVHLAETATVEALADLAEWSASAPLLVVATFRPDSDDYGETGPGRVVVSPLSRDAVRAVAAIYRPQWTDGEIDELIAETGGIPLAVHRLASEWAQETTRREVHAAAERATEAGVRLITTRGDLTHGIEGLQRLIEQRQVQLAPVVTDSSARRVPYRGLEAFAVDDADLFFGRDQLLAELVSRVASAPIVIVVGASGSGKSSLVQAGLLPALSTGMLWESGTWRTSAVTPGTDPVGALESARAGMSSTHHVVVIDPLEELWTACADAAARTTFCDLLVDAARDEHVVPVACVRADFVDRIGEHAPLAALVGANALFVPPMTSDELRRVVEGPAQRTGITVEPQLVEAVIADVEGRPGALPLLSMALLATWERRERRTMTLEAYRSAGGVATAMADIADGCYESLSPTAQHAARRILLHLAGEENGVDVRRRVPLAALGVDDDSETRAALDALVARRLVIVDHDVAEVAHEALLRDWPRLARWLDEDRDGRRLHQRLTVASTAWADSGRDPSELYRGARLEGALAWADDHPDDLAVVEREFLHASQHVTVTELEDARTRARIETRRSRRLRLSLVGIVVLLVVAIIAGTFSIVQRGRAQDSATRAERQALVADDARLATEARTRPVDQIGLALLLGVEARRLDPSSTADSGLETALAHVPPGLERVISVPGGIASASVSPDGRHVVGFGTDGKGRIFDLPSGRVRRALDIGPVGDIGVAGFSPDGRLVVASGGTGGAVRVFNAQTGRPTGPPLPAGAGFVYGDFLPSDPTRLVTASPREVIRWDISDPKHPRELGAPITLPDNASARPLTVLRISADGRTVATGLGSLGDFTPRGSTLLWDLETGTLLRGPLVGLPGPFTPDGARLTLDQPGRIVPIQVSTGAEQGVPIVGLTAYVNYILSSDGQRLAVSDFDDDTIRVFDVASGRELGHPLALFANPTFPVAFLAGDRLLVSGSDQLAVWRYLDSSPSLARLLHGHTGLVDASFISDGKEVVSTGITDHQLLGFRADNGESLGHVLDSGIQPDSTVAFSPDGRTAAVPEAGGIVEIWDRRTARRQAVLRTGEASPLRIAWNPTGSVLATAAGIDRSLVLWDMSDPRHPKERARLRTAEPPGAEGGHVPVFSPDGRVVVVNDYDLGRLTFLDVAHGRVLRRTNLGGQVFVPVYSPDSRSLALLDVAHNGVGDELELVDAATGRIRTSRLLADFPLGLAFVDGGRRIVTLSLPSDAVLDSAKAPTIFELSDATTLHPIGAPITLADHGPYFANANPSGTAVVNGTIDGSGDTVLWNVKPRDWEAVACRIAGRNLTRAERRQYVPGRSYQSTCPQ